MKPDPRIIRRGDSLAMGPLLMRVVGFSPKTVTLECGNAGELTLRDLLGGQPHIWGRTWTVTSAEGDRLILRLVGEGHVQQADHTGADIAWVA